MSVRSLSTVIVVAVLAGMFGAAAAMAAPPSNDGPGGAGTFDPYVAAAGKPTELAAIGEMVEATADRGVPRCLGDSSFDRTIWYRIPEVGATQWLTISAVGRTVAPIDLAAYVQPELIPPATQTEVNLRQPNVCDGIGAGGSDAAQEPTSAISLLVPPYRPVYVQVGRRGPVNSVDAERVFLYLNAFASEFLGSPPGDTADPSTPRVRNEGANFVGLAGATITAEDPAEPTCPSLGTVWRRLVPNQTGERLIRVTGSAATTLAAYAGRKPTGDNVLDCVNRETGGALDMVVPVKRNKPVWIRMGAERTTGDEEASLTISDGENVTVVDGGAGGFDPTPGGPAGGFPGACDQPVAEDADVSGAPLAGTAAGLNRFQPLSLRIQVNGARLCDVNLILLGPRGAEFARGRAVSLATGKRRVALTRSRTLVPGRYKLRIEALSSELENVRVTTKVSGRLTKK
jgi:hypothetical protein